MKLFYFHVLYLTVLLLSFPLTFKLENLDCICKLSFKNISSICLPFLKYLILQAIYFGPDEYRKPFDILVLSCISQLHIFSFLSFILMFVFSILQSFDCKYLQLFPRTRRSMTSMQFLPVLVIRYAK